MKTILTSLTILTSVCVYANAGTAYLASCEAALTVNAEWPECDDDFGFDRPGDGYIESRENALDAVCFVCGTYESGSSEWDEKNQEWLDSDEDIPYPDDLREVDGCGYRDSQRAAEETR